MKRIMVWGLVGLIILAATGIAVATTWSDKLVPGEYITTNIFNLSIDPYCTSTMQCAVVGITLPHITMATNGPNIVFLHQADLSYGMSSQQNGAIYLNAAVLHWALPSTVDVPGSSKFTFDW